MSIFKFKHFDVNQSSVPQKIGTDAMVLGALVNFNQPQAILDVGTGCGVIALMLAQKFPQAEITGIDIDQGAVLQAQLNFKNADFINHFHVICQDFTAYFPTQHFDLIVSNPPFFNTQFHSVDEKRNLARHEGKMRLIDLIHHAERLLSERGELWMIVPHERSDELIQKAKHLHLRQQIQIFGKPYRYIRDILVFSKEKKSISTKISSLTIRNQKNEYTKEYKGLTAEFHYNKL